MRENGKKEIVDYLKSLGGSPYLSGADWDPEKFNISRILQSEPYFGTLILLDFEFKSYYAPDGYKQNNIASLIKEGTFSWFESEKKTNKHFTQMLEETHELHLLNSKEREKVDAKIKAAIDHLQVFREVITRDLLGLRCNKLLVILGNRKTQQHF